MLLYVIACTQIGLVPNPDVDRKDDLSVVVEEEDLADYLDLDGDGYSVEEGDCEDSDAGIFPGQIDVCDDVDNDCDGIIDEDVNADGWEPNDSYAYFSGLYEEADTLHFEGVLSTSADVDRFQWYVTDPIGGFFQISIQLDVLSENTDYIAELWLIEDYLGHPGGLLQTVNNGTYGEQESIEQSGIPFYDDAGLYEVVIYAFDGGGCDAIYNLEIDFTN